jgi:hypothetical protein
VIRRLVFLFASSAVCVFASYSYDGGYLQTSSWQVNGGAQFIDAGSYSFMVSTAGSAIYLPAVPGTNPNDYEVESALWNFDYNYDPDAAQPTFIHFLRADSASFRAESAAISPSK